MAALRELVETRGLFCSLYSDCAGHFFVTPKHGGRVDASRPTQVGRALQELGIEMIAAHSPQARGRSERNFGTWQGRLPQELRVRGIRDLAHTNEFLRSEIHCRVQPPLYGNCGAKGQCVPCAQRKDLGWIFCVQHKRTVNNDNTLTLESPVFQLDKTRWRNTLAGQSVIVQEHLDGRMAIRYGPMSSQIRG